MSEMEEEHNNAADRVMRRDGRSSRSQGPQAFTRSAIDRRRLLALGAASGLATMMATSARARAQGTNALKPEWMLRPGFEPAGYGAPSPYEEPVQRSILSLYSEVTPSFRISGTPLERLQGTITPNGLHFETHHSGVPEIDPARHRLLIHGLVDRPLVFTVESLLRYPSTSKICFLECSGNSFLNTMLEPRQASCGTIHGLVSCSEWTGMPLRLLLDEAGIDSKAAWIVASGADSAAYSRSIPLSKVLDDALLALFQNGERLRPEQGYPMRIVLPGWEASAQVKWVHAIEVTAEPGYTRDETSRYSDLRHGGTADLFTFPVDTKSVITNPSPGMGFASAGYYEITGLAWSGHGRIDRVEVSVDGGAKWREAELQGEVLPQSLTRFRTPWRWNGAETLLQSRAFDEHGNGQPTRAEWTRVYASNTRYHYNAIQTWRLHNNGDVENVYV